MGKGLAPSQDTTLSSLKKRFHKPKEDDEKVKQTEEYKQYSKRLLKA